MTTFYTPKIIDPAMGTGAFLLGNPPYPKEPPMPLDEATLTKAAPTKVRKPHRKMEFRIEEYTEPDTWTMWDAPVRSTAEAVKRIMDAKKEGKFRVIAITTTFSVKVETVTKATIA